MAGMPALPSAPSRRAVHSAMEVADTMQAIQDMQRVAEPLPDHSQMGLSHVATNILHSRQHPGPRQSSRPSVSPASDPSPPPHLGTQAGQLNQSGGGL